jgi:hypothetical protein
MKREASKFFSGAFAALAFAHAAYAVITSRAMIEDIVFLGRRWGVGFVWTEAGVYSAISLALGYLGWFAKTPPGQQLPDPSRGTSGGPAAAENDDAHLVGR